jgi:transcriptional antiterminator
MIRPRLTKEQRLEIIQMYDQGKPIAHLAQQFKVTRPTIYNVIEEKGDTSHKKIDFYFEKKEEDKDMSEVTEQNNIPTNFLGVKIDTENGPSNPKIRKALDKSFHLLDIMMFIEVTKFKLNIVPFGHDVKRPMAV